MKIATIVGARPQFVKAAMLSQAIAGHNEKAANAGSRVAEVLIHTGQHYDYEMSDVFFETLALPSPAHHLNVGSGPHGWQTAEILKRTEEVLIQEQPDIVVVYGDTNSTLAGALAAAKMHLPVAHVEAGLRSFNRRMPEEINRVLTDHISDLLFVPTQTAVTNLEREGITRGVFLVGDIMHDAAMQHLDCAREKSTILQQLGVTPGEYALATVHRAENTDSAERLGGIVHAFQEIGEHRAVVWPVHPRTRKALETARLTLRPRNGLRLIAPLSYQDMLVMEAAAKVILTDSGGVQKEAFWFGVPCITLRDETEWIETLAGGWNQLSGADEKEIARAYVQAVAMSRDSNPLSKHREGAAGLMVDHLLRFSVSDDRWKRLAAKAGV